MSLRLMLAAVGRGAENMLAVRGRAQNACRNVMRIGHRLADKLNAGVIANRAGGAPSVGTTPSDRREICADAGDGERQTLRAARQLAKLVE